MPQPDGQVLFFFLGAVVHLLSSLHTLYFSIRALKRTRILYAYQLLQVLAPRCGHGICSSISFFALPTRTLQVFQSLPVWPHLRHLLVRKTCWNAPLLCCCSFPTSPFILFCFCTESSSPSFCMWSLSQREHTAGTLRYQLRCPRPPHPEIESLAPSSRRTFTFTVFNLFLFPSCCISWIIDRPLWIIERHIVGWRREKFVPQIWRGNLAVSWPRNYAPRILGNRIVDFASWQTCTRPLPLYFCGEISNFEVVRFQGNCSKMFEKALSGAKSRHFIPKGC